MRRLTMCCAWSGKTLSGLCCAWSRKANGLRHVRPHRPLHGVARRFLALLRQRRAAGTEGPIPVLLRDPSAADPAAMEYLAVLDAWPLQIPVVRDENFGAGDDNAWSGLKSGRALAPAGTIQDYSSLQVQIKQLQHLGSESMVVQTSLYLLYCT